MSSCFLGGGTPRSARVAISDQVKQTAARSKIGDEMNPEVIGCDFDHFIEQYFSLWKRNHRVEDILLKRIERQKDVAWPVRSDESGLTDEKALEPLYGLIGMIRNVRHPYQGRSKNRLHFRHTPNSWVVPPDGNNTGNYRIDACLSDVEEGRLKRINEIVPMEFKLTRC